jgi:hypothetical protein
MGHIIEHSLDKIRELKKQNCIRTIKADSNNGTTQGSRETKRFTYNQYDSNR